MQYILTQRQIDNLVPKNQLTEQRAISIALRKKVLSVAKFVCIHDQKIKRDRYCDDCPVSIINNNLRLCELSQNYSK